MNRQLRIVVGKMLAAACCGWIVLVSPNAVIAQTDQSAETVTDPGILSSSPSFTLSCESVRNDPDKTERTIKKSLRSTIKESSSKLAASDLLPSRRQRLFSMLKLEAEILDQPDYIWKTDDDDDDQPDLRVATSAADDSEPRATRNPDQWLWKATLTLDLSKFMLSSSAFKDAFNTMRENPEWFNLDDDPLANEPDPLTYLARARPADCWGSRLLAGFSASVSVARRPEETDDMPTEDDPTIKTFSLSWDPASLLVKGTDWEAAAAALQSYAEVYDRPETLLGLSACGTPPRRECVLKASGLSRGWRVFLALVPKLQVKSVDQFDYVKAGRNIFLDTLSDKTIETYTLTWDFSRAAQVTAERNAALRFHRLSATAAPAPAPEIRLPRAITSSAGGLPLTAGQLFYIQLETRQPGQKLKWAVVEGRTARSQVQSDQGSPGLHLRGDGLLAGYPQDIREGSFDIEVTDAFSRTDSIRCTITRRRGTGPSQLK
jgi:hypothetical protein